MLEHDGLGADESHRDSGRYDGEPIIGANVVESGNKTVGTITDLDGKFTLNVSKEATLVITYVGFTEKSKSKRQVTAYH